MRFAGFVLIGFLVASVFFLPKVSSQLKSENVPAEKTESVISIHAKDRGFPRVNFEDGKDLSVINYANQNAAPARLLTSADFDSDGTPDLITADSGGNLKLYRGNVDSIYPNSAEAQQRRETETFTEEAFLESGKSFFMPISPDFLFTGDFNADGHQDILAATKNDTVLHLLAGDGGGNFAEDFAIRIDGQITALTTGEIGRRDGQTDLAVAILNKKGAQLLVFEHPEGAFKYKPEIIRLPSQANDLAIGNLDEDFFADVAIAGGNKLTVVHGRGQAYPWDLLREYDIKRPAAISETRVLPFEIAALTIGKFTEKRGDSLAILTTGGTLQTLDSPTIEKPKYSKSKIKNLQSSNLYVPSGFDSSRFAVVGNDAPVDEKTAKNLEAFPFDKEGREKYLLERNEKFAEELQKLSAEEQKKMTAEGVRRSEESRARAKAGFLKTISPSPFAPLAKWNLQTLATDARLTSAANSTKAEKLIRVRVSGSGKDELAFLDANAGQIHLFAKGETTSDGQKTADEIISLDVETNPAAILPMRLNADALSDLVVLREGSSVPSIVMTAPANTFVVNTSDDLNASDCQTGNPCSLRYAINRANENSSADMISFNIGGGGGVRTILPLTPLPDILGDVTIDATTQPGYSGSPLIEIKGASLTAEADGLRVRHGNTVIRGLAINEFKTRIDQQTGSYIGGNGIAVFTVQFDPNNTNNIIEANFFGTDPTGTVDKGNQATGLNIFDSDNNIIGGTASAARNVMSGNGSNGQPSYTSELGADSQNALPPVPGGPVTRGVGLSITDGKNTQIKGNYIGTDRFGTQKINNSSGVFFTGKNNEFGGDEPGAGNTVSGNGDSFSPTQCYPGDGIKVESLVDEVTSEFLTANNNFKGNRIGTTADGTAALANCGTGLITSPRHTSVVGSITETGRNTISGNQANGLYCASIERYSNLTDGMIELPNGFCSVVGNNVGTNVAGSSSIPNLEPPIGSGNFVLFFGSLAVYNTDTLSNVGAPGGTSANACTGFCNLVSGNTNSIGIGRASNNGTVGVFNNYVGTNKSGAAALPNASGVDVYDDGATAVGGVGVDQTNAEISLGNLISGNLGSAVEMTSDLHLVSIEGNLIGTDKTGLTAIGNNTQYPIASAFGNAAIVLSGGLQMTVGGSNPLSRNIISGNSKGGIHVDAQQQTVIFNNYIGVNKNGQPLGNASDGVQLFGRNSSVEANVIANNGRNGVFVGNFVSSIGSGPQTLNNRIRLNSIYNNAALGIDLSADVTFPSTPDGVTPNDCLDEDEKANRLQNYPLLFAPTFEGDTMTVEGLIQSHSANTYTIDFYASQAADPTGYGEGEIYLGATTATIGDDSFGAPFSFSIAGAVTQGMKITATATDSDGNTSEFSCAAGQCEELFRWFTRDKLKDAAQPLGEQQPCGEPIVVNIATDEPIFNPASKICEIDADGVDECSLRAALVAAKNRPGFDWIQFRIPGSGTHVISVGSALPEIDHQVYVDGNSQPPVDSTGPRIEVRGNGSIVYGFVFNKGPNGTSGSSTSGLFGTAVSGFATDVLVQSDNNIIDTCYFGLLADGAAAGNRTENAYGVRVFNAAGNRIEKNTISNNQVGVSIEGSSTGTRIRENKIGTNTVGFAAIPNTIGVAVRNSSTNSKLSENTISGNLDTGLLITDSSTGNDAWDNLIGIKLTGGAAIANDFGVVISNNATSNTIRENVISGNRSNGILMTGAMTGNKVLDNLIGTDVTGSASVPNALGIVVDGTSGFAVIKRNTISGNAQGLYITGISADNVVEKNKIGTNEAGDAILANSVGVTINSTGINNQITDNTVSGNTNYGIQLSGGANHNKIRENVIGTNAAGDAPLPNGTGIRIQDTAQINEVGNNTISGNTGSGVAIIDNAPGNKVLDNKIGTNKAGQEQLANNIGISLKGDSVLSEIKRNTISGNTNVGLVIGDTSHENIVQTNKIGTNPTGLVTKETPTAIPNLDGILIWGDAHDNNIIENVISGNTSNGIIISENAMINLITGNKIGTDETGSAAIKNEFGVRVEGNATQTDIDLNTIAGNAQIGVLLTGNSFDNEVQRNKIGTNHAGTERLTSDGSLRNGFGVQISGSSNHNKVHGNLVSGHIIGILVGRTIGGGFDPLQSGANPAGQQRAALDNGAETFITDNEVYSNSVGVNAPRNAAIPNMIGIAVGAYAQNNLIGTASNNYNLISGNTHYGIYVGTTTDGFYPNENTVKGNAIGLSGDGEMNRISNNIGIFLEHSLSNIIGGATEAEGNVIVASSHFSVDIQGNSYQNYIKANACGHIPPGYFIPSELTGTKTPVPPALGQIDYGNGGGGIRIGDGSENNIIGGSTPDTSLTIANNGGNGITIDSTAGKGNRIGMVSIFNNAGLGIDLNGDGIITPNDLHDADIGPNNLQNYPEIVSHQFPGGNLVVNFKVDSAPINSAYGTNGIFVQFFKADASGEGEKFLGSAYYTVVDYNGGMPLVKSVNLGSAAALGIGVNDQITATATDADGNTSEFTPAFAPTAANVSISGRVLSANGTGVFKARISLTGGNGETRTTISNSFGYYEFPNVEVGQTYIVAVRHKQYQFEPPARILNVMEELTNVDFTISP